MYILILKGGGKNGGWRTIQFTDHAGAVTEARRQYRENHIEWTICPLETEA